jgi:hypothetical protein
MSSESGPSGTAQTALPKPSWLGSRRSLRGLVRGGVLKGVLAQVRKIEASTPMRVPKTPRLRPGVNARVVPAPPAEIISLRVFRHSHH